MPEEVYEQIRWILSNGAIRTEWDTDAFRLLVHEFGHHLGRPVDLADYPGALTSLWVGVLNNDAQLEKLEGEDGARVRHTHLSGIEDRAFGLFFHGRRATVPELRDVPGRVVNGRRISSAEQAMAAEAQASAVSAIPVERVASVA